MKKLRIAVYAGSFDPFTKGHLNIIVRTAPLFDKLVILIAVDFSKKYMFTKKQRLEMVKECVQYIPNVTVEISSGCYIVKHALSLGAQVLIRGLRNTKDMEREEILAEENRNICPQIETIWIPCLPKLRNVSSSLVKGHLGVDQSWKNEVARLVPKSVLSRL